MEEIEAGFKIRTLRFRTAYRYRSDEYFAPKYRRQVFYKDIKADVGQILGTLCRRKGIEIIEASCMPDHIHMLVRIPPKYSVINIVKKKAASAN